MKMKPIIDYIKSLKTQIDAMFLLFVVAVSVFWLILRLSQNYSQVVSFAVKYHQLPSNYIFQESPNNTIAVRMKASGFYFFKKSIYPKTIHLSLENIKPFQPYHYRLSNANVLHQVEQQVQNSVVVEALAQETFEFVLGEKKTKKVSVIPDVTIQYAQGYNSLSGVQLEPDSIWVSGPELQLQKLKEITLQSYQKKEVDEDIAEQIDIKKPSIAKLSYATTQVKLKVAVQKMTEKSFLVPLKLINTGDDQVVIYPKKIQISFQVSLANFQDITGEDFLLVLDYKQKKEKYLEVKIAKQPQNIMLPKLELERVEYLILK